MKKLMNLTLLACAFAAVVTLGACSSEEEVATGTRMDFVASGDVDATSVLQDYTSNVVVARYKTLASAAETLYFAVDAIDPTATGDDAKAQMKAAGEAWEAARIAWERTEAYLFGPVDSYDIDPGIDSWPLDIASLAEFIIDYAGGDKTYADIENDGGDLKGFHAIEFMLFKDGDYKTVITDFSDADGYGAKYGFTGSSAPTASQLQGYLVDVTKQLYYCTVLLVAEWTSLDEVAAYVDADGAKMVTSYSKDSSGDYSSIFTTAGNGSTSYKSVNAALSTIIEAAAGIADEVGGVKIADPIKSGNKLDVESWFSHNSVSDFTNNVIGIKEAYFGSTFADDSNGSGVDAAANSMSAYIASGSATLDLEVTTAIEAAIVFVSAMPAPFRDNLTWSAANTAAASACSALVEALDEAQSAVNNGYYFIY